MYVKENNTNVEAFIILVLNFYKRNKDIDLLPC